MTRKPAQIAVDESLWGNVVKKRSRLEVEKDRALAEAKANAEEDVLVKESGAMSKRRKIEMANDYWKQFGNGDIFG